MRSEEMRREFDAEEPRLTLYVIHAPFGGI
jgi:hypothetical protein